MFEKKGNHDDFKCAGHIRNSWMQMLKPTEEQDGHATVLVCLQDYHGEKGVCPRSPAANLGL